MTPLVAELRQVCPTTDANGMSLEWTDDVTIARPLILELVARMPGWHSRGWKLASAKETDHERADDILAQGVLVHPDYAFVIRRNPDGSLHTVGAIVREFPQHARWNLYVGGIPDSGWTLRQALWDVGIRYLRTTMRDLDPGTLTRMAGKGFAREKDYPDGAVDFLSHMAERPE